MSTQTITLKQVILGLNPYVLIEIRDGSIDLAMQGMNKKETLAVLRSAVRSIRRTPQSAFTALHVEADENETVDTDDFFGDDDE
jgi:hypothetical protein